MRDVFDTDTLSNLVKKKPSDLLLRYLARVPRDRQFTTAITAGEMIYGAYRSQRSEFFMSKIETLLLPNVTILPFDEGSAKVYGKTRAELEKQGRSVSEPDLRIASIAIQHGFTLVTGNLKHFQGIPMLMVENWL